MRKVWKIVLLMGMLVSIMAASGCATTKKEAPLPPCHRVVDVLGSELLLDGYMPATISLSTTDDIRIGYVAGSDVRFIFVLLNAPPTTIAVPINKITDCTIVAGSGIKVAQIYLSIILKDFVNTSP